jgi:adenylate kinase
MATRLIFMGPPGSGKGTQAQRLAQSHDLVQLSSGHVLRTEIREGSEIGRKASQYVESGGLVPDDVITGVMLAAIGRLGPGASFILDGFPRTVPQAEALEAGLAERGQPIDAVLDFQMPDDVIVARIAGRRVCTQCGATYNVDFIPTKVAGVCDACGAAVVQRKDDQPDVVRHRLETYRAQTEPLVAFYAQRGLLQRVDASVSADAVEAAVVRCLETLGRRS